MEVDSPALSVTCLHDKPGVTPFSCCLHLLDEATADDTCNRWYAGMATNFEVLCDACVEQREHGEKVVTNTVCYACWDHGHAVTRTYGRPEVFERLQSVRAESTVFTLPVEVESTAPVAARANCWIGLAGSVLIEFDTTNGSSTVLSQDLPLPIDESSRTPWSGMQCRMRLHADLSGRFVAVVNDFGTKGIVVDRETGSVTMQLDGGQYHSDTVPFSVCFAEHDGKSVIVHRTAWNRLDVSDPLTGELLTDRAFPETAEGSLPPHYLNYFHGRLLLSPGGSMIADDGWVWSPIGVPAVWDFDAWLNDNPYESEDGPSRYNVCGRWYYWNAGMCWLDDQHLVVGGLGDDDEEIVAGVRIFDVSSRGHSHVAGDRSEVKAFAGPDGDLFAKDGRLFSRNETGLSVWDVEDGARIAQIMGFRPTAMHPLSADFVEIRDDTLIVWDSSTQFTSDVEFK